MFLLSLVNWIEVLCVSNNNVFIQQLIQYFYVSHRFLSSKSKMSAFRHEIIYTISKWMSYNCPTFSKKYYLWLIQSCNLFIKIFTFESDMYSWEFLILETFKLFQFCHVPAYTMSIWMLKRWFRYHRFLSNNSGFELFGEVLLWVGNW